MQLDVSIVESIRAKFDKQLKKEVIPMLKTLQVDSLFLTHKISHLFVTNCIVRKICSTFV